MEVRREAPKGPGPEGVGVPGRDVAVTVAMVTSVAAAWGVPQSWTRAPGMAPGERGH